MCYAENAIRMDYLDKRNSVAFAADIECVPLK